MPAATITDVKRWLQELEERGFGEGFTFAELPLDLRRKECLYKASANGLIRSCGNDNYNKAKIWRISP